MLAGAVGKLAAYREAIFLAWGRDADWSRIAWASRAVRVHQSLEATPALAAWVAFGRWTLSDSVDLPY